MKNIFEPLKTKPRAVILDSDMGPDSDDVGALVTLIHYSRIYSFKILGVCNCTSNKAGGGLIDAICRYCKEKTPPIGQWSGEGFLDGPISHKYNDAVAEKFSPDYKNGTLKTEDAVKLYRRLLANAEDDGVLIITIGMFNILAAVMESTADEYSPLSGIELIRKKVNSVVSMAALYPKGREFNVYCDAAASKTVFEKCPVPMYLSDYAIGHKIITGYDNIKDKKEIEENPLALSYYLYTGGVGCNASFDLTAVQFAVLGEGELYGLTDVGRLEFFDEIDGLFDATRFVPASDGNIRFMTKNASNEAIADSLNSIIRSF